MTKFKCIHTGCIYEFTDPATIEDMRQHDEYVEVASAPSEEKKKKPAKGE